MGHRSLEQVRLPDVGLAELMRRDPDRAERLVLGVGDLRVDLSRQPVTDETLDDLVEVAEGRGVTAFRDELLAGERVNRTEDRAVAHPALRAPLGTAMTVDGRDVVPEVHRVLEQMSSLAGRVRADGRITDVVNIGIGGSDLGPAMVTQALGGAGHPRIRAHFVSNVDPADIVTTLAGLDPASTVVVVVSNQ